MTSASKRKGGVTDGEYAKHCRRYRRKSLNRLVRIDGKKQCESQTEEAEKEWEEEDFIAAGLGWWMLGECPYCFETEPTTCDCGSRLTEEAKEDDYPTAG